MPFVYHVICEREYTYSELVPLLSQLEFFQIFNTNILNENHLLFAYAVAKRSFDDAQNVSKSLKIEFLLKVSATRKIAKAIETVGFKKGKEFILFSLTQPKLPSDFETHRLKTNDHIKDVFNISDEYTAACGSLENALFELIALSTIKI